MITTGHCLCGDITYTFDGKPLWIAHCHCESCRRQTSSVLATFVGVAASGFRYAQGTPARFDSSPGVRRSFCRRCGAPMSFESSKFPGEVHLYIGTLDDPSAFMPTAHVHVAEKLPWLELNDGLPQHQGSGGTL